MTDRNPRDVLNSVFQAALAVCLPDKIVGPALDRLDLDRVKDRIVITGAGKASAAMGAAVEAWAKDKGLFDRIEGLIVTRYGHAVDCERIEIVEAAHPVPDQAGMDAAGRIKALAEELTADDVICA